MILMLYRDNTQTNEAILLWDLSASLLSRSVFKLWHATFMPNSMSETFGWFSYFELLFLFFSENYFRVGTDSLVAITGSSISFKKTMNLFWTPNLLNSSTLERLVHYRFYWTPLRKKFSLCTFCLTCTWFQILFLMAYQLSRPFNAKVIVVEEQEWF